MDLPADVAEQPLDRRVDVLVVGLEVVGPDRREPRLDLGQLGVAEQSRRRASRPAWSSVPCEVVGEQLVVVRARRNAHTSGASSAADASGPERHAPSSSGSAAGGGEPQRGAAASIRCVSAMSLTCTASWPIRSAAVNAVALRSMLSRSGS